jgi:hypothetical protein
MFVKVQADFEGERGKLPDGIKAGSLLRFVLYLIINEKDRSIG